MISIEDFVEDIVGKAMRGYKISVQELAAKSGASSTLIAELLEGKVDEPTIISIAPHLNLDPESLMIAGRKSWYPEPVNVKGLEMYNTNWADMYVNAFLVWDSSDGIAAAFDTGANSEQLIETVRLNDLTLESIYLTHTHTDHIADLARLQSSFPSIRVYVSEKEPIEGAELIADEHNFSIGSLSVQSHLTWGHSIGGLTYVINGLDRPIAIVGDALFAGSMGGGMVSYMDALKTNRQYIFTLPDHTVICPGHGPMSSIGEEKKNNPFYPEFKNN
ncbi:MBL fold metallo-hydrolase [Verrucomicrobiales bacterium]|jgi:glyoxylase-like metal-dependent hydrolase (beta-lactamase superfamily II)|nr:MBL fold metallo-hydrolase [Verrucomicrobiales bacterium]